jgi:hypothetical protein
MSRVASIFYIAVLLTVFQVNSTFGQKRPEPNNASARKPAIKADLRTSNRDTRAVPEVWLPLDSNLAGSEITSGAACPLSQVLSNAGKRVEELIQNVEKFTATEVVEHHRVDRSGHFKSAEMRKFNYVVSMAKTRSGWINVQEYRTGGPDSEFPDHIATIGTPALILIFHPNHVNDFTMVCEGLSQWQGHPAWRLRYEERRDRRNSMMEVELPNSYFRLRLRGRAWILADSYQVVHLESDVADQVPKIRLRLQHQDVDYGPVRSPETKREVWLPARTEMYMDFLGRRFYRRHDFTDIKFFSVRVEQTISDPKE